jgi:predicted O-methyltransferase YrrM
MTGLIGRILRNAPRALLNPRRTIGLLERFVPVRAITRDPDAYRHVAAWTFGSAPRVRANELFPGIEKTKVSLMRALDRVENVSVSVQELVVLSSIVRHSGARRILELGTSNGNTTLNIAANADGDARVTTVDLPPDFDGNLALDIPTEHQNMTRRDMVGSQYRGTELEGRISSVYADSATLDFSTLPGPFDLIFIDACHAYEYVVRDTQNALKHVRPGGLIVWHDYGTIEDVSRAVDEFAGRLRIAVVRGTSLAVGFVPAA